MMKFGKIKRILTVLLACVIVVGATALAACKSEEERQDEGRREQAKVRLTFLTQTNKLNEDRLQQTVYNFNAAYEGEIHVTLVEDLGGTALTQLGTEGEAPDIVSLDERSFKTAVDSLYLAPLDDYIESSETIDIDDMWLNAVERFRYDSGNATTPGKSGGDATQYAMPADSNPVMIYYNIDWFKEKGVNIISIAEEDLDLPAGYLPQSLYEAAKIDGANRFRQFFSITIPAISPTLYFLLAMGLLNGLQTFDIAKIFAQKTSGYVTGSAGPSDAGLTTVFHIYNTMNNPGTGGMPVASIMSLILFVVITLVLALNKRISKWWVSYD